MMTDHDSQQTNLENEASKMIAPIIGGIRPLAVQGIKGAMVIGDKTKAALTFAREEIEDLIAEAKFEQMKGKMEADISGSEPGNGTPGEGMGR